MAVTAPAEARRAHAARRLPDLRAADPRQAARLPRLGQHRPEAAAGARRDARRSTRRRTRTCTAASTTLAERATAGFEGAREKVRAFLNAPADARGDLHPQRDRGAQPRRVRVGAQQPRAGRRRRRHRARAPLELRAVAVHRAEDGRRVPRCSRSTTTASSTRARSTRLARDGHGQGGRGEPRLELARHDQPDREARRLGARAGRDLRRRRARRPRRTGRSTCRRSAATSSPSPATRCAGRPASGALWGRAELLEAMEPFLLGGAHDQLGPVEKTTWGELPHKFEAGTSPIAEAVGLGAAIDYLDAVGLEAIEAHEHELAAYALERLAEMPGVTALRAAAGAARRDRLVQPRGHPPARRRPGPRLEGVAIRAGHHCCQPLMHRLGVAATNRASFYLYSLPEEIDRSGRRGCRRPKDTLGCSEFDQLYREVILDHYKNPRGHGVIEHADARGRGPEPALRRRGLDLRRVRRGRRDDRGGQVLRPRLRDLARPRRRC